MNVVCASTAPRRVCRSAVCSLLVCIQQFFVRCRFIQNDTGINDNVNDDSNHALNAIAHINFHRHLTGHSCTKCAAAVATTEPSRHRAINQRRIYLLRITTTAAAAAPTDNAPQSFIRISNSKNTFRTHQRTRCIYYFVMPAKSIWVEKRCATSSAATAIKHNSSSIGISRCKARCGVSMDMRFYTWPGSAFTETHMAKPWQFSDAARLCIACRHVAIRGVWQTRHGVHLYANVSGRLLLSLYRRVRARSRTRTLSALQSMKSM